MFKFYQNYKVIVYLGRKYNIDKSIIQGIQELGFRKPTPVQTQVIPCLI